MENKNMPLAARMRPEKIEDVYGQEQVLGHDSVVTRMINGGTLHSLLLYGPPGCGKTTIAEIIAKNADAEFIRINAVAAGKKDIADACNKAEKLLETGKPTVLFIDEIHRFNKAQQDYLLPYVENGTVTLIGSTTENPHFEVNPALVSRCILCVLEPVRKEAMERIIRNAVEKLKEEGKLSEISEGAVDFITGQSAGDARRALSILESAVDAMCGQPVLMKYDVEKVMSAPYMKYDKDGQAHYDNVSAFIKSMRGSDPDAVLYYLARMIESGEDVKFIARRIMICASEDVGNADPMALTVATSAALAAERVGLPEARIMLSQAALYIATAPKSSSAIKGIDAAVSYVKKHPSSDVPPHLRDAHYKSAEKLGHGIGYKYPHDYSEHYVRQQYLPDEAMMEQFYENSHMGYEKVQADYLNWIQRTGGKRE